AVEHLGLIEFIIDGGENFVLLLDTITYSPFAHCLQTMSLHGGFLHYLHTDTLPSPKVSEEYSYHARMKGWTPFINACPHMKAFDPRCLVEPSIFRPSWKSFRSDMERIALVECHRSMVSFDTGRGISPPE